MYVRQDEYMVYKKFTSVLFYIARGTYTGVGGVLVGTGGVAGGVTIF